MAKFVDTTWAACFARQNPVSTSAKPACMKITSTAPMTTQRLLSPRSVWLMPLIGLTSIDGSSREGATLRNRHEDGRDHRDDPDSALSVGHHAS